MTDTKKCSARHVFKWDELGKEILGIAFPAALAVAADPIASLIDTIFVGHIGTYSAFTAFFSLQCQTNLVVCNMNDKDHFQLGFCRSS